MFSIGLGLLLYRVLHWLLIALLVLLAVPFVMNLVDGKGYGHNFRFVWNGLVSFLKMGFERRKQ